MIHILNNCVYFEIVVNALHEIFLECGIQHLVTPTIAPEDFTSDHNTYIIFTTHHFHEQLPKKYISYNFEQLITNKKWEPAFFQRLYNAQMVWDYSMENIRVIKAMFSRKEFNKAPPTILHVPFGYHKSMDILDPNIDYLPASRRHVKWLMVGAMNPLRMTKLQPLIDKHGKKELIGHLTNNCWGRAAQHEIMKNALVGMNLHFYDGPTILEVHRIVPLVANGVLVVSERSSDVWYDNLYKDIVTFVRPSARPFDICRAVDVITKLPDEKILHMIKERRDRLVQDCCYSKTIRDTVMPMISRF